MQDYKIIINGKEQVQRAYNIYTAVRSIMCWYTVGTFFIVLDSKNKTEVFQIIATSDPISGHRELLKIS